MKKTVWVWILICLSTVSFTSCNKIKDYFDEIWQDFKGKWDVNTILDNAKGAFELGPDDSFYLTFDENGTGHFFSSVGSPGSGLHADFDFSYTLTDDRLSITNQETREVTTFEVDKPEKGKMTLRNSEVEMSLKKDKSWKPSGGNGANTPNKFPKMMYDYVQNSSARTSFKFHYTGNKLKKIETGDQSVWIEFLTYYYTGDLITSVKNSSVNLGLEYTFSYHNGKISKMSTRHYGLIVDDYTLTEKDGVIWVNQYPGKTRLTFKDGNLIQSVYVSETGHTSLAYLYEYDDKPAPFSKVTGMTNLFQADYFINQLYVSPFKNNPTKVTTRSYPLNFDGSDYTKFDNKPAETIYTYIYQYQNDGFPTQIIQQYWDEGRIESTNKIEFTY